MRNDLVSDVRQFPHLQALRIDVSVGLRRMASAAIKAAIAQMDIYGQPTEIRLNERQLCEDLGVSRTPIRETLSVLEQEGFVRSVPRRGVYVVRKTTHEIVELIVTWAAIESMAAGRAATRATAADIAALREMHSGFLTASVERIDEYSQANFLFHREIIRLGECQLMTDMTNNIFVHMQPIRAVTIRQDNRARRSVQDHLAIIQALENRDAALAERLVREHALNLAAHVEKYRQALDGTIPADAAADLTTAPAADQAARQTRLEKQRSAKTTRTPPILQRPPRSGSLMAAGVRPRHRTTGL
jgi:DNA-binding GntR family transcriptional regulator